MKKLSISWDNVHDDTGYLFSFAKCLCCALKNSRFSDFAEDIIATSGFAFRMWMNADLCPSATSIWDFNQQDTWIAKGGIITDAVGRYWGQDEFEESRRKQAIENIRKTINNGIAAITWDIDTPEWGLITGYDDDVEKLFYLAVNGKSGEMPYHDLGQRQIKILNVITIENKKYDWHVIYLRNMFETACSHLSGNEWSGDNKNGLSFYPAFCGYLKDKYIPERKWNAEYYLGTYGALKWYAYKIFDKYGFEELAALYKDTYNCWIESFNLRKDFDSADTRDRIIQLLNKAHNNEIKAVGLMKAVHIDDEAPPAEQDYTHIHKWTDMKKTLIKELSMKNSAFNDIDLSNTKYVNLCMKNSTFYNINIDYTSFCGSNMNSMGYVCVSQHNSRFIAADLSNSVFLENCNFENVEIMNSNIKGLKINGFEIDKLIEKESSKQ